MDWQLMGRIQRAMVDARARTGDPAISVAIESGIAQITRVVYPPTRVVGRRVISGGAARITNVGAPDTPEGIITKLNAL